MYRSPSPIFDSPELLTHRQIKPLPKRRRASSEYFDAGVEGVAHPPELPPDGALGTLGGSPDPLSAQLALQSYYMPVFGGMQDLFKTDHEGKMALSLDYGVMRHGRDQDEDSGEADYVDHIQQPGNTKKRKVPANLGAAGHGDELGEGLEGDEEVTDRAIPTGRPEHEYDYGGGGYGPGYSGINSAEQRRFRIPKATLAGLSHKEMLRSRKRQLATVLGALTHGDTLALDQALSANYPFASTGIAADLQSRDIVWIRLSRRPVSRLARAFKAWRKSLSQDVPSFPFPEADFTFVIHSASK